MYGIKITAQHPADKITVTAKYGNSNKSEKFYVSIPEPNFYIQNSIPKDGNISVHSDIQNVVSYKWSKESGKIVDEALYPNDTSRINVTIDIELTYSGTLMANADIGVEDVEKNTNTAELQWITDKGEYNDRRKDSCYLYIWSWYIKICCKYRRAYTACRCKIPA